MSITPGKKYTGSPFLLFPLPKPLLWIHKFVKCFDSLHWMLEFTLLKWWPSKINQEPPSHQPLVVVVSVEHMDRRSLAMMQSLCLPDAHEDYNPWLLDWGRCVQGGCFKFIFMVGNEWALHWLLICVDKGSQMIMPTWRRPSFLRATPDCTIPHSIWPGSGGWPFACGNGTKAPRLLFFAFTLPHFRTLFFYAT